MKIREGDLVKVKYGGRELIVEVVQIMDKILVKEPDEHSYLEGGHRPFLVEDENVLEVVDPVEG